VSPGVAGTTAGPGSPADKPASLATQLFQLLTGAGLISAVGYYLYWSQQSGFFGAFSVSPEQVGVSGAANVERLSVPIGMVTAVLSALAVLASIARPIQVSQKDFWSGVPRQTTTWLSVVLCGIGIWVVCQQAFSGKAWQPQSKFLIAALVVAMFLVIFARRYWTIFAASTPADQPSPRQLTSLTIALLLFVGTLGYVINAWSYIAGVQLRDNDSIYLDYLTGKTPPTATVEWRSCPSASTNTGTSISTNANPNCPSGSDFRFLAKRTSSTWSSIRSISGFTSCYERMREP
jgi:hypothetical protein